MAISIEVDGVQYEGFIKASVETALDTLSGKFFFQATIQKNKLLPFHDGQHCSIRVSGERVLTGFIEKIRVRHDYQNHDMTIEGRDLTCDIVDSHAINPVKFQSAIALKDVILQTLAAQGMTGFEKRIVNQVTNLLPYTETDKLALPVGGNIFQFLAEVARKRQVFLVTDGLGNIVMSRSLGIPVNEALISDPENPQNSNVLSANVTYDSSDRFRFYDVRANFDASSVYDYSTLDKNLYAGGVVGFAEDTTIRKTRVMGILSEKCYEDIDKTNRAKWECGIRRVHGRVYTCSVQGHNRGPKVGIWKINHLVKITDKFCDIKNLTTKNNDTLLVNAVKYSQGVDEGSITELTFIDQDAYLVEANKPAAKKKKSAMGNALDPDQEQEIDEIENIEDEGE